MQNDTGSAVPASYGRGGRFLMRLILPRLQDHSQREKSRLFCRWTSSVGQDLASGKILGDGFFRRFNSCNGGRHLGRHGDLGIGGQIRVQLEQTSARLQFRGQLVIETNNDWQEH